MSDPANMLDSLVARAQRLCSLPAVAMKVLELTNNPVVDTHALKQCIENDPALTSKILRVVNSSLFGLSREVSDLNQALALLGSKPLKLLVLGFSLPGGLFVGVSGEILGRYWRRTLTKAVAAREISESVWKQPGDDAFIAGLLQDLGMLLLIQELGQPYVNFLEKVRSVGEDLAVLEVESMGFDHTTLSARMLSHWGLPEAFVEAVSLHPSLRQFDDLPTSQRPLPQIVHLAELVARLLVDGQSTVLGELLQVGQQYHDLSEAQLEVLVSRLEEKVSHLADVLSLQLPNGLGYQDVLAQAQVQLAEVAADAAAELLYHQHSRSGRPRDESVVTELKLLSTALSGASSVRKSAHPARGSSPAPVASVSDCVPAVGEGASGQAVSSPPGGHPGRESYVAEVDPGLLGRLEMAVTACRQSRCSLSLLLVALNQMDRLLLTRGVEGLNRLRGFLEALCRKVDHPSATCMPYGEAGFALVLPDCDRQQAVGVGNQLIAEVRELVAARSARMQEAFSISVGAATVALPPKNFPPEDLVKSASRCLYGSRTSGGSVMKSLEIY